MSPDRSRPAPPIFVVGVPRSGTTLLAAMLGAHARIICGPETHFFSDLLPAVVRQIRRRSNWPAAALDYLYSIRHVGESIPANYGLGRDELAGELARRKPSVPSVLTAMLDLYMRRNGKQRWVEKTPDHLPCVEQIRGYYPDSPIIRIIRDPRDVVISLVRVSWGPDSLLSAIELWRRYDDASARFFARDRRCHTLHYKDLVRDPEPVLRDLCRAIDEPFDSAMLDTSRSAQLVNAAAEPWKAKAAEGIDTSRVEAWRKELSGNELRLIEAHLGDRLLAYGYPMLGLVAPHAVEVHTRKQFAQHPEVAESLVERGARFWRLPGERPALALFLDDPNGWLPTTRLGRLIDTARLVATLARYRRVGIPVEWIDLAERGDIRGRCARLLSLALPSPADRPRGLDLAPSGDGPPPVGTSSDGVAPVEAARESIDPSTALGDES